ncbi:hypothetical protein L195_g047746, partial [Trifolium pratense]
DAEGNEISRPGYILIDKMSFDIKEHISGWEDMFSLGGGYLHLKLQVAFSDEE